MKHKIDVPEGCKVISVETTDEMVVVKFEKEESSFKENEILFCKNSETKWIAIFDKCKDKHSFYAKCVYVIGTEDLATNEWSFYGSMLRLATDSEKQLLFDKLKEKFLMFDGKDVVRWRAGRFKEYYSVYGSGLVSLSKDAYIVGDEHERRYNIGNYFPTLEMAESFQKQYIDLLNNFHKNL